MSKKIIGIIPARYGSSRFEGKPLAMIQNKPMIQWVYERTKDAIEDVIVATDNLDIVNCVESFGGKALITSDNHFNGTSRCLEAIDKLEKNNLFYDYVINIQGDEPLVYPEQITELSELFSDSYNENEIYTLVKPIDNYKTIESGSEVFVTFTRDMYALYFSRNLIPFNFNKSFEKGLYYKHIGLYGFNINTLRNLNNFQISNLEKKENLEQLRWLENGCKIKLGITTYESQTVDTPRDLELVNRIVLNNKQLAGA